MVRRRRRGRSRRVDAPGALAVLFATAGIAAAVWFAYLAYRGGLPGPVPGVPDAAAAPPAAPPSISAASEPEPGSPPEEASRRDDRREPPPAPPEGAVVALVIDDLGRRLEDVAAFEALGVPVTYAVLPFERLTPEVAADLARRRAPFLVHLPMEGRPGADPGPGALTTAMTGDELVARTREALAAVPGAVGANNHMGSVLTADSWAMERVLREVAGRGLFFLDSRTSGDSVAYRTARDLGMPAAERQVFLDPDAAPEAVRGQFLRLLDLAHDRGAAIAIGHPHPATLAVLALEVPRARRLGYRFVAVAELLEREEP